LDNDSGFCFSSELWKRFSSSAIHVRNYNVQ
jgi:hypothetical protein